MFLIFQANLSIYYMFPFNPTHGTQVQFNGMDYPSKLGLGLSRFYLKPNSRLHELMGSSWPSFQIR